MVVFIIVVVLCCFCYSCGTHILSIGDSIDRYIVEDFCLGRGAAANCADNKCSYWAEGGGIPLTYRVKGYPTHVRCDMGNDSFTTLHNYGSSDAGPYFSLSFAHNDTYSLTPHRIARALELYFDRVGVPDLVIYHGTQWDIQGLYERGGMLKQKFKWDYEDPTSDAWKDATATFETSLHHRVTDIVDGIRHNLERVNKNSSVVNIGLRTAVWNSGGGPLLHAFNAVTRKVSMTRNVTLFDLDNDVWGAVGWNLCMFIMYSY
jgi:hypothetical protein